MIAIEKLLYELDLENTLIEASLSQEKKGAAAPFDRVTVRPVIIKEALMFQFECFKGPQAFHENLAPKEGVRRLTDWAKTHYKQLVLYTSAYDYDLLINRQGQASVKRKAASRERIVSGHDRKKVYVLEDGVRVDYLVQLGVMDEQGKVYKKKYDKFRQLNRFLEFVEDCMPHLSSDRPLRILDFGCGKAYLTFALYHYLVQIKGFAVEIIGLDLKTDVIAYCNEVAKSLQYDGLRFLEGDIRDYEQTGGIDMVVTLHACDNATDEALAKAAAWGAQVILSVPCCQHEFFKQLDSPEQAPMLKHGILRDKLNSLVTDSLRGLALEALGYEVQMLEFIDMTHTPKNVLIRAFKEAADKGEGISPAETALRWEAFTSFKKVWGLKETFLEASLKNKTLL